MSAAAAASPGASTARADAPGASAAPTGRAWAPASAPPPLTGSRRTTMFVVVAVALIMSTLDGTIVATALPALKAGLHTSVTLAGWTITAYSLGLVLALSLAGKLCQRYGSRRVFTASVAVFTAASLCCGLVGNIYLLIVLRFIQAAGGAGFTPAATSIVVQHFGSARDKAVGLFGSFFTTGAMIGPVLGGLIVASWSWRGVFLVNVPLGVALIPLVLHFVPRDRPRAGRTGSSLDLPGVLLLGVGLLGGMIALTLLGDTPADDRRSSARRSSAWPGWCCSSCTLGAWMTRSSCRGSSTGTGSAR